jgi:hypothetical protein
MDNKIIRFLCFMERFPLHRLRILPVLPSAVNGGHAAGLFCCGDLEESHVDHDAVVNQCGADDLLSFIPVGTVPGRVLRWLLVPDRQ